MPVDPAKDVLSGSFWLDGFLKVYAFGGKLVYPAKSGSDQFFGIICLPCYQPYRNVMFSCPLQNAFGKFSHQCLAVGMSFAGDDEIGLLQLLVECGQVEQ